MFGTIRRHSTALWIVVIALTIVSFVIFFTPDVGRQSSGGGSDGLGAINGRPVLQEDFDRAQREVALEFGNEQQARARGVNLQQALLQRLIVHHAIRELNVEVGDTALANFIKASPTFQDRQSGSGFRKDMYDGFLRRLAAEQGLTEQDFLNYLRTQMGIQHLQEVYGQPGKLMTPSEAEELYRQVNEQFNTELAAFTAEDYVGKVQANSTNLSQFYSNRIALYKLPERLVVNFVKFDFTNYAAEAEADVAKMTNLPARLDAIYNARGPGYYSDTNNQPLPIDVAKGNILREMKEELAALAARKAANAFATELDNVERKTPETLVEFAAKMNVPIFESQPFSEYDVPAGLKVMENFARQAFSITPEEPFKGPIQGADSFFVISLKRRIPSEIPAMESILQKVMDDYRVEQSSQLAREAGEQFGAKVAAGMAAGKTFEKICAEEKVTPRSLPPFALTSRSVEGLPPSMNLMEVQGVVQSLSPGQASKFSPTRDGGFVVFVKSRLPVSEDRLKQELPEFITGLRRQRQEQAFQEWFRRTMDTVRLTGRLANLASGK